MARVAVPVRLALRDRVVRAGDARLSERDARRMRAEVREQLRARRRADLVVDDREAIALGREPQHRLRVSCRRAPA